MPRAQIKTTSVQGGRPLASVRITQHTCYQIAANPAVQIKTTSAQVGQPLVSVRRTQHTCYQIAANPVN